MMVLFNPSCALGMRIRCDDGVVQPFLCPWDEDCVTMVLFNSCGKNAVLCLGWFIRRSFCLLKTVNV